MSSTKTTTRTIRIDLETAEYFKEKPLNRYVEGLYKCIQSGEIKEQDDGISVHTSDNNEVQKPKKPSTDSVYTNDLKELLSYAPLFRMPEEEYVSKLKEAIDNGVLMEENGKFIGVCQYDMSVLEEKCKQSGMSVQGVIDKMTKMIGG